MAIFNSLFKRPRETVSTLDPAQQRLRDTLGSRYNALTAGPEYYPGQLTEPIGAGEEQAIGNFNRLSALGSDNLSRLINVDEPAFRENFQSEIANPTYADFRQNVQPILEESLPSFSTARANVLSRSLNDLQGQLLQQRFGAREAAQDRSLRAIGEAQNLGRTSTEINAIPREIKQAGLEREFARFSEGQGRYQQNLNSALQFLGIQTQAISEQPSNMERIIAILNTAKAAKDMLSPDKTKVLQAAATGGL